MSTKNGTKSGITRTRLARPYPKTLPRCNNRGPVGWQPFAEKGDALSAKWLPPKNDRGAPSFVKRKSWPDFCVLPRLASAEKTAFFRRMPNFTLWFCTRHARWWLKYRLANKRGVAGSLDAWPGDCNAVTPVPVIVSPPGIDADGCAAGLRRD